MNRCSLVAVSLIMLVGCLKTRADIEAEESGRNQQMQNIAQQKTNVKSVQSSAPAPAGDRMEEYDEQMRQLSGRVDSVENGLNQLNSNKQNDRDSFTKDKTALEQKFLAYEEALKKLEAQIASLNDEVARLKAPPPEPVVAAGHGKTAFELGEEQFTSKKWKEAIVSYQKYRDTTPKGKVYPDATYKIGVCFQELGMKDEARAFYEEVTVKFPSSKEAKKAALRMKTLR